jgi:hypothetical protein
MTRIVSQCPKGSLPLPEKLFLSVLPHLNSVNCYRWHKWLIEHNWTIVGTTLLLGRAIQGNSPLLSVLIREGKVSEARKSFKVVKELECNELKHNKRMINFKKYGFDSRLMLFWQYLLPECAQYCYFHGKI